MNPTAAAALADEYTANADKIAALTARQDDIKTLLAALGDGKHTAGDHTITITRARRFDARAASAAYPSDTHPQYWGLTLDRKKLEQSLPPVEFDEFKKPADTPTVTVK